MKFEKCITINIGNYQSIKLGVSDAPDFASCDKIIIEELMRKGIPADKKIRTGLGWLE